MILFAAILRVVSSVGLTCSLPVSTSGTEFIVPLLVGWSGSLISLMMEVIHINLLLLHWGEVSIVGLLQDLRVQLVLS